MVQLSKEIAWNLRQAFLLHLSLPRFQELKVAAKNVQFKRLQTRASVLTRRGSMTLEILHAVNGWPLRNKFTVLISALLDTTSQVKIFGRF